MILGIGSDIVDMRRIEKLLAGYGGRFEARVYHPAEIAEARRRFGPIPAPPSWGSGRSDAPQGVEAEPWGGVPDGTARGKLSPAAPNTAQRELGRPVRVLPHEGGAETIMPQACFYARRFAAKEAVAKALGCGIGQVLAFTDIAITNDDKGKPVLTLEAAAENRVVHWLGRREPLYWHVSLSDEPPYALAFVVLEVASD